MTFTRRQTLAMLGVMAATPAFAKPRATTNSHGALARGFNLPDLVPVQHNGKIDAGQLKRLRAAGMTHIRLPIVGENFMPLFSGSATIADTVKILEETLNRLLRFGFAISVDMHPADEFANLLRKNPDEGLRQLTQGWTHIAPVLRAQNPDRVFAELLNEPSTEDAIWRPRVEALVNHLRPLMPRTMFIVGPAPYQRVEALAAWKPLRDRNITYAFHYYDPMAFTHQGQTWLKDDPLSRLKGFPFPARKGDRRTDAVLSRLRARKDQSLLAMVEEMLEQPWNEQRIKAQFAELKAWKESHKVPVILNEFGVLRFASPRADRLRWLSAVRRGAEQAGFGWAHWDYSGGFGLIAANGSVDEGVLQALTGRRASKRS